MAFKASDLVFDSDANLMTLANAIMQRVDRECEEAVVACVGGNEIVLCLESAVLMF